MVKGEYNFFSINSYGVYKEPFEFFFYFCYQVYQNNSFMNESAYYVQYYSHPVVEQQILKLV